MRVITLFEDRQSRFELSKEEMDELIKFKVSFGQQNFLLQVDGTLLVKHYVGYISGKNIAIQVLPKVYQEDLSFIGNDEKEEAVRLFFRLLMWSDFDGIKELPEIQKVSGLESDLLEIFISLFVGKFLELFARNVHRQYREYEDNVLFIKGKIDFTATILQCGFKQHLHHVRFDELTVDNLLNRLFKTVLILLEKKTKSGENRKMILTALSFVEDIEPIAISTPLFNQIKFNRLNIDYQPLFNMARMFFFNMQPGFKEGDSNVFTFLVPLNKLFEYYVYRLIREVMAECSDNLYEVKYQGPQEYLAKRNNQNEFKLEPDITILHKDSKYNVEVIADAKYKNPVTLSQSDIYQVLSYAVHYSCPNLFLIYPSFKNDNSMVDKPIEYSINTASGNISLTTIQVDVFEKDIIKLKKKLADMVLSRAIKQDILIADNI